MCIYLSNDMKFFRFTRALANTHTHTCGVWMPRFSFNVLKFSSILSQLMRWWVLGKAIFPQKTLLIKRWNGRDQPKRLCLRGKQWANEWIEIRNTVEHDRMHSINWLNLHRPSAGRTVQLQCERYRPWCNWLRAASTSNVQIQRGTYMYSISRILFALSLSLCPFVRFQQQSIFTHIERILMWKCINVRWCRRRGRCTRLMQIQAIRRTHFALCKCIRCKSILIQYLGNGVFYHSAVARETIVAYAIDWSDREHVTRYGFSCEVCKWKVRWKSVRDRDSTELNESRQIQRESEMDLKWTWKREKQRAIEKHVECKSVCVRGKRV